MSNLYSGVNNKYSANGYTSDVNNSYRLKNQKDELKEFKKVVRIRNLSISLIVFVSLWLGLLASFLCVFLLQLGFANKYPTVTIEENMGSWINSNYQEIQVETGFEYIKNHLGTVPQFIDFDQEQAWGLWVSLCIGLACAGVSVFSVSSILLMVLNSLTKSLVGVFADTIISGVFKVLFIVCGFTLVVFLLKSVFGIFDEGWLLVVGIILAVVLAIIAIAIAVITLTLSAIYLSGHTLYETNKEIKEKSVRLNI